MVETVADRSRRYVCVGAVLASAALAWVLGPVGDFGATVPGRSPRVPKEVVIGVEGPITDSAADTP